jgi:hypothetical protein
MTGCPIGCIIPNGVEEFLLTHKATAILDGIEEQAEGFEP